MEKLWASVSDLPDEYRSDTILAERALRYSSFILWSLTGQRFTPNTSVIEYYDTRKTLVRGSTIYPMFIDGQPYNVNPSCTCSCGITHTIRLREQPVRWINGVWVNGEPLDATQYILLDNSVVALLGSAACGSSCVKISYVYGTGLPQEAKSVAATFAIEFLRDWSGRPCQLPRRVKNIDRDGVSMVFDPQDFLADGRVGLYEVDLFLHAVNPTKSAKPSKIFSPDIGRAHRINIPNPPTAVILASNDQAVTRGVDERWVSTDRYLVNAVREGHVVTTSIESPAITLSSSWVAYRDYAYMDVHATELGSVLNDTTYTVYDNGIVIFSAALKILE